MKTDWERLKLASIVMKRMHALRNVLTDGCIYIYIIYVLLYIINIDILCNIYIYIYRSLFITYDRIQLNCTRERTISLKKEKKTISTALQ